MKKLIVICGPTATGKTKLAIDLAKTFGGEIVSADSRQIYKELDIGTGKDLPKKSRLIIPTLLDGQSNSKKLGYYKVGEVCIWGYDLIGPDEEFNVSSYFKLVTKIIDDIYGRGEFPILVGGTGLYIKAIVDGIDTSNIAKNISLRESLENYDIADLYNKLSEMDPIKAASLNFSDKNNPRRLLRAIEIADYKIKNTVFKKSKKYKFDCVEFIGLTDTMENISVRIKNRINSRLKAGLLEEIGTLINRGISWESQAMSSLGYLHWKDYFEKSVGKEEVLKRWLFDEIHYAKRQLTWFKKDKRIKWFLVNDNALLENVEREIKTWYDQCNGTKS